VHQIRLHGPWSLAVGVPVGGPRNQGEEICSDWGSVAAGSREQGDGDGESVDRFISRQIKLPVTGLLADLTSQVVRLGVLGDVDTRWVEVVLERRFNRPTGLVPEQRCYVGIWSEPAVSGVCLNEIGLRLVADVFPGGEERGPAEGRLAVEPGRALPTRDGPPTAIKPSCFSLPVAELQGYNLLRLVYTAEWSQWERLSIHKVALGIC